MRSSCTSATSTRIIGLNPAPLAVDASPLAVFARRGATVAESALSSPPALVPALAVASRVAVDLSLRARRPPSPRLSRFPSFTRFAYAHHAKNTPSVTISRCVAPFPRLLALAVVAPRLVVFAVVVVAAIFPPSTRTAPRPRLARVPPSARAVATFAAVTARIAAPPPPPAPVDRDLRRNQASPMNRFEIVARRACVALSRPATPASSSRLRRECFSRARALARRRTPSTRRARRECVAN
jgi:hypothetical protein